MNPTNKLIVVPILVFLTAAVRADDISSEKLLSDAQQAASAGDSGRAVELLTEAIQRDPELMNVYYLRGREHFRLGKVDESVADFDKFVKLRPGVELRQWERGISYYYAGQYENGAKQFELYQTYHDNDVENSVWRYLCAARVDGVAKARANMLPIKNDTRVPMMQIYGLFRGRLMTDDVLIAAKAGDPEPRVLNTRLFYAHVYIGLYHEANGDQRLARQHILKAADDHKIGHYMWDVAKVHADRFRATAE